MTSPKPMLTVGEAPHLRSQTTAARWNYMMLLALLPTAFLGAVGHAFGERASELGATYGPLNRIIRLLVIELGLDSGVLWFFGILGMVMLAMGSGMFIEYAVQVAMRQPYRTLDGHGALIGLLLVLMLPPTVPGWVLLFGVAIAIFLGKQLFGGVGGYPMHPAAVGWLILILSWPHHVYPVGAASIAAPSDWAVLATLAGGLVLWVGGAIRPQIALGTLAGVTLFSLVFAGQLEGGFAAQFLTGHVFLAAFFLAPDPTCSPANRRPMWLYGFGTGFLIVLIRAYGIWPDAIPFAIVLMNVLTPLLDLWRPRPLATRCSAGGRS
jgi:electron transport complex protein RnfD